MPALLEDLTQILCEGLTNNTLNTCSRWAANRRIMGEPFPGPYTKKYHPWVGELHDTWAPFNYCMKGAQLGVTEVAINRTLYTIDRLKRNVLYVLPTQLNAADFSKSRFGPAIAESDYLASMFTDTNSVGLKQAGPTSLYIRGSKGDSNLKSVPASELILDELDEMDQRAIWLSLERLSGQIHKHVWGISTPTIPNFGIHKLFLGSTEEYFVFKCPSCSRQTHLVWPDCVEIIGESPYDPRCKESYLKCKECGAKLPHEAKPEWLGDAKWVPFNQNGNPDVRGFAISQLYSYTVKPGELVVAYLRGMGDELAAREFYNSKLGLPFIAPGAQVTDDMVSNAVRRYSMNDPRPRDGGRTFITMGVDQGTWNYVTICEWKLPQNSVFDIHQHSRPKVRWAGKFHENDWHILYELMGEWQVLGCVLDADPNIGEARRFARNFPGYVWLCRYRSGQTAREIAISDDDTGAPMATVDRTNFLSTSLGRFKYDPARIELPQDIPDEWRKHATNLVRTYEKAGTEKEKKEGTTQNVATFKNIGPDHFAHSLNYAEIALPLSAGTQSGGTKEKFSL